jgi:hypothetical protein
VIEVAPKSFTIQKLGGDADEAFLRFVAPFGTREMPECYVDNEVISNLAHVLEEFLRRTEKSCASYILGSFEEKYAGGALRIELSRLAESGQLTIALDLIDEESKGVAAPQTYLANVAPADLGAFAGALRVLYHSEQGHANLAVSLIPD